MSNVLSVLKVLNQGENYLVQIPNYQRIGNDTVDNFDLFKRKEIPVPTPFELIGNENRLNISVENKIYGEVTLNPKQAKRVNLPTVITGPMIHRRKTIIKDGQLNSSVLELIIDMKTYFQLQKANVIFEELENKTNYPGKYIKIDLSLLDITNNKVDYTLEEILNNVKNINELKAKQKVLNSLKKQLSIEITSSVLFTEEQLEMLKDHGLDENLQYIGVDNEVKVAEETYAGDVIEFKVKGSSMNTLENVLKRVQEGKKLNELDNIQYEYYNQLKDDINTLNLIDNEDIKEYYNSKLKKIKLELFNIKLRNTFIKMEFINSPLKEVALDDNNQYTYKGLLNINIKHKEFTL